MITKTEKQTIQAGRQIAKKLRGGDIVLLRGELGAGKTTLIKGLAKGLGIKAIITSPTFSLMNVYLVDSGKTKIKKFVHIDTYRLENEEELRQIGADDYLGERDTVCVIEWPEKVMGLLTDKKVICLAIKNINREERRIEIV